MVETKEKMTKEDQGYINEFSRLHQKNKVITAELKLINEKIANIKDADMRCDELFGENTKILIGETFMEVDEDKAKEVLSKQKEKILKTKKDKEDLYNSNKKRLDELKIILYSKFQNSINLDE